MVPKPVCTFRRAGFHYGSFRQQQGIAGLPRNVEWIRARRPFAARTEAGVNSSWKWILVIPHRLSALGPQTRKQMEPCGPWKTSASRSTSPG